MLVLPAALRRRIAAWATDGYPHETCGLLIGRSAAPYAPVGGGGGVEAARVEVVDVHFARNLNRERAHDRYELDPADHLAAENAARAARLDVVGVWHSHPDHPARPSETDRVAAWPGWSYVIVAVERGNAAELRSWRLAGDTFLEEEILEPCMP